MQRIKYFLLFIIFLLLNCLNKDLKKDINNKDESFFINRAEKLYKEEKYSLLNRFSTNRLKLFPGDYKAAYYKALSLGKTNRQKANKYYIDYIMKYQKTPKEYKDKWMYFALEASKFKKIKNKIYNQRYLVDLINIKPSLDQLPYCKPKILNIKQSYFFLDSDGSLYRITKNDKKLKKINYYKTRDFSVFNDYIIFNDSINLIKYYFEQNKYQSLDTFNEDEIYIYFSQKETKEGVIKYIDTGHLLNKYMNFESNEKVNLPNNFISPSPDYSKIVLKYDDKFEIFDMKGNMILSLDGEFISFGIESDELFFYQNQHLHYYNLSDKRKTRILYIPQYKKIKGFSAITPNRIFLSFDEYLLFIYLPGNRVTLIEGDMINIFNAGVMYKKINDTAVYFYDFMDNDENKIFNNSSLLKKIVYSDHDSNLFLIKEKDKIIINSFSNIF